MSALDFVNAATLAARDRQLPIRREAIAQAAAALATGSHLLLNGGETHERRLLALVVCEAAITVRWSFGTVEVSIPSPPHPAHDLLREWGAGISIDLAALSC